MNTEHIERVLKLALCHQRQGTFLGVFPIDHLSSTEGVKLYKPGELRICILNTDPSNRPGRHWFLLGIDCRSSNNEQHYAFMFDSLAQCEKYKPVWKYLTKTEIKVSHLLFNKQVVQDLQVDSCALHVIYFTTMMIQNGFSFRKTMATYNVQKPLINDCKLIDNFQEFLSCQKDLHLFDEIQTNLPETMFNCSN